MCIYDLLNFLRAPQINDEKKIQLDNCNSDTKITSFLAKLLFQTGVSIWIGRLHAF